MLLRDESQVSLVDKMKDFFRSLLPNANGRLQGKVIGNGPAEDMKRERDKLPLLLQLFGVLPCFSGPWAKPRPLHARKVRRGGVDRSDMYKDADGEWQPFPKQNKLTGRAKKLGFKGSWRSPSLKPGHALKREHAALVRAKLAE